jgi:hypothetical protein
MKNAVLWDIKTQFIPHRKHVSVTEQPINAMYDLTFSPAVTMKNAVSRGVTLCGSCKNRSFRGTYRLHHQGGKNERARNN